MPKIWEARRELGWVGLVGWVCVPVIRGSRHSCRKSTVFCIMIWWYLLNMMIYNLPPRITEEKNASLQTPKKREFQFSGIAILGFWDDFQPQRRWQNIYARGHFLPKVLKVTLWQTKMALAIPDFQAVIHLRSWIFQLAILVCKKGIFCGKTYFSFSSRLPWGGLFVHDFHLEAIALAKRQANELWLGSAWVDWTWN